MDNINLQSVNGIYYTSVEFPNLNKENYILLHSFPPLDDSEPNTKFYEVPIRYSKVKNARSIL